MITLLTQLYIENIAVIEKAGINFDSGLNVLTGETGAGKSIVIDSINAILGERTSREIIRNGSKSAFVSATFCNVSSQVIGILHELGYELEDDGTLLVQREINQDGKTICRINARPATVSVLKQIGVLLINIHGQHDSYDLLSPDLHIHYIEQEELMEQRTMYINSEKIATAINTAKDTLDGNDNSEGVLFAISTISGVIAEAERYLPSLNQLIARLKEIEYDLQDCSEELRNYSSQLEYNPNELEQIENRLDVIYRLSLKYGESVETMIDFLNQCKVELQSIELSDKNILKLTEQYNKVKENTINLAKKISNYRSQTACEFSNRVKQELNFLDMPGIDFQVQQERCPLNSFGCDKIQFLISTNPGEPAKPIAKIASGGELSRIMLAIKTVLAGKDDIDTLIFDEVDTGVSGSAAQKVGLKLREASKNRQVICVTHLAQIAALADSHFLIKKHVEDNKTFTDVTQLHFEGRKHELARIMGGTQITELMLENAAEMLKMANCS